jgi:transposase
VPPLTIRKEEIAVTIVGADRAVIGGVDTIWTSMWPLPLDPIGGVLGVESFAASPGGYEALLEWLASFGTVTKVGTGAYGAGLCRFLVDAGIEVIEVDRPNRQVRRQNGKSDPADAVEAARGVLSGRSTGKPKTRDGNRGDPALLVAKRSAPRGRLRAVHQMRQLGYTAPDELRSRFKGRSTTDLVAEAAAMRPRPSGDPVVFANKVSLRSLGRRCLELEEETDHVDSLLAGLVERSAPGLHRAGEAMRGHRSAPRQSLWVDQDVPGRQRQPKTAARTTGVRITGLGGGERAPYEVREGDDLERLAGPSARVLRSMTRTNLGGLLGGRTAGYKEVDDRPAAKEASRAPSSASVGPRRCRLN